MSGAIDRAALEEAISWLRNRFDPEAARVVTLIAAASAHLETLPKTCMINVWRVEFALHAGNRWVPIVHTYESEHRARKEAAFLAPAHACLKVTGPHLQEVPS